MCGYYCGRVVLIYSGKEFFKMIKAVFIDFYGTLVHEDGAVI